MLMFSLMKFFAAIHFKSKTIKTLLCKDENRN